MRTAILASAFVLYAIGATVAYAGGGCHSACPQGQAYSQEAGGCVDRQVNS